jgi:hypothetical protein
MILADNKRPFKTGEYSMYRLYPNDCRDIDEYRTSFALYGVLSDARIIPYDGERFKLTGSHHPFGEGHRSIVGRCYDNGVYRQLVEVNGWWRDCMIRRGTMNIKSDVLESRFISPAKAAQVADYYGIKLFDADGDEIMFYKPNPIAPVATKVPRVPGVSVPKVEARVRVGSGFSLSLFLSELKDTLYYSQFAELISFLTDEWKVDWGVSEYANYAEAWPTLQIGNGDGYWPVILRSTGVVILAFQYLKTRKPWTDEVLRTQFASMLQEALGVATPISTTGRPAYSFNIDTEHMLLFKEALRWFKSICEENK